MSEELVVSSRAVLYEQSPGATEWKGVQDGDVLRAVALFRHKETDARRIVCLSEGEGGEALINCMVTGRFVYTRASDQFHTFVEGTRTVALNFATPAEAAAFGDAIDASRLLDASALPPPPAGAAVAALSASDAAEAAAAAALAAPPPSAATAAGSSDEAAAATAAEAEEEDLGNLLLSVAFLPKDLATESMKRVVAVGRGWTMSHLGTYLSEEMAARTADSSVAECAPSAGFDLWIKSRGEFAGLVVGRGVVADLRLDDRAECVYCHRTSAKNLSASEPPKSGGSSTGGSKRSFGKHSRKPSQPSINVEMSMSSASITSHSDEEDDMGNGKGGTWSGSSGPRTGRRGLRARFPSRRANKETSAAAAAAAAAASPGSTDKEFSARKAFVRKTLTSFLQTRSSQQDLVQKGVLAHTLHDEPPPLNPGLLARLGARLEEIGAKEEGVYRVSAQLDDIRNLTSKFYDADLPVEVVTDAHILAGAIKLYIRELDPPIVPPENYEAFIAAEENVDDLKAALADLPTNAREGMLALLGHLKRFSVFHETTLMSPHNLGVCFGPAVLRTHQAVDPLIAATLTDKKRAIIETMIDNFDTIQ